MATGLLNQMLGQAPRAANPGYPPHSQDAAGAYTAFAALRNVAGIQSHPLLNAMQVGLVKKSIEIFKHHHLD
jgi:hypothetical protein